MKSAAILFFILVFAMPLALAQTMAPSPPKASSMAPSPARASSETLQLQMLTKKIEEQNAKIDILSQQILKLEQQLTHVRPGIMIGEAESTSTTPATAVTPIPRAANGITTHTVARGETLTSIAKLYGISIGELQRFNRIEDPLKLRAGQTLMIPPASTTGSPSGE
jgi:LysM repeat protein